MNVAENRADTKAKTKDDSTAAGIWETVKVIIQALLIALVFRTLLFHPFNIPSGSMIPTLEVGDYLFVSKFSYGYGRYSAPVDLPFIKGRIWKDDPERGDVAVFRLPRDPSIDYIKRVIGLPGDKIQMQNGVLFINDEAVNKEQVEDYSGTSPFGQSVTYPQYRETLPNGVSYLTLDIQENSQMDNTDVYEVPPGHYFMMGDNRDNSQDSRFQTHVGFVPEENLIGRAETTFFSVGDGAPAWAFWRWPWTLRFDRFFNGL